VRVPVRAQEPVWGQVPEPAWALEQVSAQGWVPVSAPALVRGQAWAPGPELVPGPAREPARVLEPAQARAWGWVRERAPERGPALVPVLAQVSAREPA
jgi:hypothetical protein